MGYDTNIFIIRKTIDNVFNVDLENKLSIRNIDFYLQV